MSSEELEGNPEARRIMQAKINDRNFPEDRFGKFEYVHRGPNGQTITVHFWRDLQTGAETGLKIKMIQLPNDLRTLFAMHDLGLISLRELRSWALSALEEPIDERLLEIGLCSEEDSECIEKAVSALFDQHGLTCLAKTDVLRIYAAYVAGLIVQGEIAPRKGADLIASATNRFPVARDFHDLDPFKYASSEMQDRPEDQRFFEKAIIEEAQRWSASPSVE